MTKDEARRIAANIAKLPGAAAAEGSSCRTSGHPLNLYDALRMTVAESGEIQDQAGRPRGERAKVAHGLCDHRDVAFNLDLHVWRVAAEACPQSLDRLGCVSHSRVPSRWPPQSYSHSTLAGLYRAARVGLVTPLRDGMNLVAKEYVASQNSDDPGVLILSRFAGAAQECKAALLVNPYDPDSVAAAIGQALSMPLAERRERHDALFRVLSHNDIQHWADRFLAALEREPTALSQLEQMPSVDS
jgi:hypothetical protein